MDDFATPSFSDFVHGRTRLDFMTFRVADLFSYELSRQRFKRVRDDEGVKFDQGYARREIRDVDVLPGHPFGTIVQSKQLKTDVAGRAQKRHTDIHPAVAVDADAFVLIGNIHATDRCCVLVGDREVWLAPGVCVVFPAWVIHAGSGFKHASRIYVLFSSRELSDDEVRRVSESSETLGFSELAPRYFGFVHI